MPTFKWDILRNFQTLYLGGNILRLHSMYNMYEEGSR